MSYLLIKLAERRYDKENLRSGLAVLSGFVGIICNILLSGIKFFVGAISNSVSITADATNNLSDAAVNIVTIIGAKLSSKPVDKEHPFGHGRTEYIAALIVAFSIIFVSYELGRSSFEKIISPEEVSFSIRSLITLICAVGVKLWMAFFNHKLYKKTDNLNLKAIRQDSLNDCVATTVTAIALVLSGVLGISWLDGAVGLCVAVFVFWSGVGIVREILNPLLGQAPSRETTYKLEELILDDENILGVHDLMVHDYGMGKIIASAHAEVRADIDVVTLHHAIDSIERRIADELGISISIHMDPVETDSLELRRYRREAQKLLEGLNKDYSFHDFRVDIREGRTLLSFDVVVPFSENDTDKIKEDITFLFKKELPETELSVTVEHPFT